MGADLFAIPLLGHSKGDISVFLQGLLWAKGHQLDLLVKLSRRFLPLTPWVDGLARLAHETQHHTFSNECKDSGLDFQMQALGMHVDSHYAMLPEYFRGVENDPGLVEAYIHQQIAQKIPNCPLDRVPSHESLHKGYATWTLLGNRLERGASAYWHQTHGKSEYQELATSWGLALRAADFR